MQVQQLSVKVLAVRNGEAGAFDQEALIPIFHTWIREQRLAHTTLIDVADYRHVPRGPGVMLIADGEHYGFDEAGGRPGLLYGRKRDPIGDAADKLRAALRATHAACAALQAEPSLAGTLSFASDELEIRVMSRLCARNTDADYQQLRPVIDQVLNPLVSDQLDPAPDASGEAPICVERVGDEREPLTVRVTCRNGRGGPNLLNALAQL